VRACSKRIFDNVIDEVFMAAKSGAAAPMSQKSSLPQPTRSAHETADA